MKRYLTSEEKIEILSKSNRFTAKQLAEQYGCSRSTILKLWMDNDYHKPPSFSYYVNDNYFSIIDTPNKAYVVGLIASDGNVYKRDGHDGQIRLSFQDGDSEHQLLTSSIIQNDKNYEYISISIVSQKLFEDICNIGIAPKKTWKINLAQIIRNIPKQFIRDFLRGYFDGDGSINITKKQRGKTKFICR